MKTTGNTGNSHKYSSIFHSDRSIVPYGLSFVVFLIGCLLLTGCELPAADMDRLVLTHEDRVLKLNGEPISRFGLRAANALQSDEITDRLINSLGDLKAYGMQSIAVTIQGGRYSEGGNSVFNGFNPDGTLDPEDGWMYHGNDSWYLKRASSERHFILGTIHGPHQHFLMINEDGMIIDEYPRTTHLDLRGNELADPWTGYPSDEN